MRDLLKYFLNYSLLISYASLQSLFFLNKILLPNIYIYYLQTIIVIIYILPLKIKSKFYTLIH